MNQQIAVLGDLHFDIFSNLKQERMYDYQEKFFKEVFFPEILSREIKTIVQVGDLFDNRTKVSQRSLAFSKRVFFDVLQENDIRLIVLTGNHDIFYKDSLKIVTTEQVLGEYSNIELVKKPTMLGIYGKKYSFVPWICKENEAAISRFIENDSASIAFGHLELAGGKLNKYATMEHGSDIGMFKRYNKVYSGHFHSKSTFNNVEFVGIPYELTRIDANEQKSFLIIEQGKEDIQINNPFTLYEQIVVATSEELKEIFSKDLNNKYVEITIDYEIDPKAQEKFCTKLNDTFIMHSISVVSKREIDSDKLLTVDVSTIKNNRELIDAYNVENKLNEMVASQLVSLYNQAVQVVEA